MLFRFLKNFKFCLWIAICFNCYSTKLCHSQIFDQENHRLPLVIEGRVECRENTFPGMRVGKPFKYAILVLPDSVVYSRSIPGMSGNKPNEYTYFCKSSNEFSVPILCISTHPAEFGEKVKRKDVTLLQGKSPEKSVFESPTAFEHFSLGGMLFSDSLGISFPSIQELATLGTTSKRLPTGLLSLTMTRNSVNGLIVQQRKGDIQDASRAIEREIGWVAEDGRSVESVTHAVSFEPPLNPFELSPWKATVKIDFVLGTGERYAALYELFVNRVSMEQEVVQKDFENLLSSIPPGFFVAPADGIAREWQGGDVKLTIDENALDTISGMGTYTSTRSVGFWMLAFIVIGGVLGCLFGWNRIRLGRK